MKAGDVEFAVSMSFVRERVDLATTVPPHPKKVSTLNN
jgi:hypothetical protein